MPNTSRSISRLLLPRFAATLLLLAAGCGHDPLSSNGRPGSGDGTLASDGVAPIASLALSRGADGPVLTMRLGHDPGVPTLPLAPVPAGDRSWTFQVAFDLDRNARTGDASGAERAIALVAPDRAAWLSLERGAWRRVAESDVRARGARIEIDVPEGALPRRVMPSVTVESYVVTSAGAGQVAVNAVRRTGFGDLDGHERVIPMLQWMRASARGDSLVLRAQIQPSGRDIEYDPATPGGWMLQVFLNTDENDTGYWLGFDYIVRGGEWTRNQFMVRRIEPGDQWPGGWGPPSGQAKFDPRARSFSVTVPRSAMGGDDCRLRYGLEVYETVECPQCPSGVTHTFFDTWFGETSASPGRGTVRPIRELASGAPRYGIAAPPSSTDRCVR